MNYKGIRLASEVKPTKSTRLHFHAPKFRGARTIAQVEVVHLEHNQVKVNKSNWREFDYFFRVPNLFNV